MESSTTVSPRHDKLRQAVRWISDHGPATNELIEEAGLRFNLSPVDAEFLRTSFTQGSNLLPKN